MTLAVDEEFLAQAKQAFLTEFVYLERVLWDGRLGYQPQRGRPLYVCSCGNPDDRYPNAGLCHECYEREQAEQKRREDQQRLAELGPRAYVCSCGQISDLYSRIKLCSSCYNRLSRRERKEGLEREERYKDRALWQTHCKRGHEFTAENTYSNPSRPWVRNCRSCQKERAAQSREKSQKS